ncbi:MAG: hypothetical protein KC613_02435, partial [Myxococcales bacterium]|nr:hypothetical protein [Myxococcales bacterium]
CTGDEQRCVPGPAPPPRGPVAADATLCFSEHEVPYGDDPAEQARQAAWFAALGRMGVRTLRQQFQWHRIERAPGEFDWSLPDGRVGAADLHGVETLALLGYGNYWASALAAEHRDPYYPPDDPQDFARFAAAFAARYPQITRFEIWNEQNAGYRFWKHPDGPSGQPDRYADLLVATAQAIRAVRPDAVVGFGGLFYLPQAIMGGEAFLEGAYAARPDVGQAFDALAWHPYSFYPPLDPPERDTPRGPVDLYPVDVTAARLQAIMTAHEGPQAVEKPLWITELGWPSVMGLDEARQADYLARGWLLALAGGVDTYCIYRVLEPDPARDALTPWEPSFGLLRYDADPLDDTPPAEKPAVAHLTDLRQALAGLRYAARRDPDPRLPPGVHWLVFTDDQGQHADVLWAASEPAEVVVPLAGSAQLTRLGQPPEAAAPPLRLTLDGTPVVIRR